MDLLLLEGILETHGLNPRNGRAICPAHDDKSPSLSYSEDHFRILLHCHAGCQTSQILQALRIGWGDLFSEGLDEDERPVAEYEYRDTEGRLVYVVERFPGKKFRQRSLESPERPLQSPVWRWSMDGVPRYLYRLPKVLGAVGDRRIFVVEGEKDVHTLEGLGLVATCNSGGSSMWREEHAEWLEGAKVVILPDNDDPGEKWSRTVVNSLIDKAVDIRVVNLPNLPEKGDVTDWIAAGGTLEELKQLTLDTAPWMPGVAKPLASVVPHEVRWFWRKHVPEGKLTMVGGVQGTGKSHFTLAIIAEHQKDSPESEALLITYEDDPVDTIRPRAEKLGIDLGRVHVWDARCDEFTTFSHMDDLKALLKARPQIDCIVLDPVVSALGATDTYRDSDVRRGLYPLTGLGKTVIGIMHLTKDSDRGPLHRFMGSTAFTALARSVVLVEDSSARVIKSNVGSLQVPTVRWQHSGPTISFLS